MLEGARRAAPLRPAIRLPLLLEAAEQEAAPLKREPLVIPRPPLETPTFLGATSAPAPGRPSLAVPTSLSAAPHLPDRPFIKLLLSGPDNARDSAYVPRLIYYRRQKPQAVESGRTSEVDSRKELVEVGVQQD